MPRKIKLVKHKPLDQPKTSIIATIGGPDRFTRNYISGLIDSGMNIARINLAHVNTPNDYKYIKEIINQIKEVTKRKRCPVALLFDIGGPKIRIGDVPHPVQISNGDSLILTMNPNNIDSQGKCKIIPVTHDIDPDVKEGNRVLINDGRVELIVSGENPLTCTVLSTAVKEINSHDGINLPKIHLSAKALTHNDFETIRELHNRGISKSIDFFGLSFVKKAEDFNTLEAYCGEYVSGKRPEIIAKIETWESVETDSDGRYKVLDEIVDKFSGIMVARGDLAGETSPEEVPVIQSYLSKRGIEVGRAVIIATQMLISMKESGNRRPTRSEASDVANAVFDYVDAVMLSDETARGDNPSLCVQTMRDILIKAENSQKDEKKCFDLLSICGDGLKSSLCRMGRREGESIRREDAIAQSAILFAENLNSPAIVVSTSSGDTAIKISKYRPCKPIIAFTDIEKSASKMLLYRGIYPFLIERKPSNFEHLVQTYKNILRDVMIGDKKLIPSRRDPGILLPLTLGIEPGVEGSVAASGNTNTIYILEF